MAKEKDYWRQVVENTLDQLSELRASRDEKDAELQEIDTEIMQLERLLTSLAPFTSEAPIEIPGTLIIDGIASLSLADACREILRASGKYKTARGVRDALKDSGYDLSRHNNALASIHGVLKRMYESGEIGQLEARGRTFYRWKVKVEPQTAKLKLETFAPTVQIGAGMRAAIERAEKMENQSSTPEVITRPRPRPRPDPLRELARGKKEPRGND